MVRDGQFDDKIVQRIKGFKPLDVPASELRGPIDEALELYGLPGGGSGSAPAPVPRRAARVSSDVIDIAQALLRLTHHVGVTRVLPKRDERSCSTSFSFELSFNGRAHVMEITISDDSQANGATAEEIAAFALGKIEIERHRAALGPGPGMDTDRWSNPWRR